MPINEKNSFPSVSVVIPAYNAEKNIVTLIESLLNLDYPKEKIELIIIDNNSTDETKYVIKKYPIKLFEENRIQSSYAARNKGINHANGEIIAFTDSDCIVTPQWVKEGVKKLISESADLAGGKIEFIFSDKKTVAEIYDSIMNMQTEEFIKNFGTAPTANLFVKSTLFSEIGLFPEVESGGDFQWTAKATREGYSLVYAPGAIVRHPARTLKPLLVKNYRVGKGALPFYLSRGNPLWKSFILFFRAISPPNYSKIKEATKDNVPEINRNILELWLVAYICKFSRALGILVSFLSFNNKIFK